MSFDETLSSSTRDNSGLDARRSDSDVRGFRDADAHSRSLGGRSTPQLHHLPPGEPLAPPVQRRQENPQPGAEPPFGESLMLDSPSADAVEDHRPREADTRRDARGRRRLRWPTKDHYHPGTGLGHFGRRP